MNENTFFCTRTKLGLNSPCEICRKCSKVRPLFSKIIILLPSCYEKIWSPYQLTSKSSCTKTISSTWFSLSETVSKLKQANSCLLKNVFPSLLVSWRYPQTKQLVCLYALCMILCILYSESTMKNLPLSCFPSQVLWNWFMSIKSWQIIPISPDRKVSQIPSLNKAQTKKRQSWEIVMKR